MNLYWITYDPENGDVVPDAKMREYAENFIAGDKRNCVIGSAAMIDEFRLLVARGKVEGGQLRIGTRSTDFSPINECAVLADYPNTVLDDNLHELILFSSRKFQERRKK